MKANVAESFFIGDHPINDYQGSYKLGFKSIWLEGSHSWPQNLNIETPLKIKHLSELCPLIEQLKKSEI